MEYACIGRSGIKVSRITLGTMNFGQGTTETDAHDIITAAVDAGINSVDTADVYGGPKGAGYAEEVIGRWLCLNSALRDRLVITTKVYYDISRRPGVDRNLVTGLSAKKIRWACEQSLRRLKSDYIDIYAVHHIDRNCRQDEIWSALESLTAQGKILYVATSNYAAWHICDAQHHSRRFRLIGPIAEQSVYNLINRAVELEVIPACRHFGLGFFAWSPLGGGMLASAELGSGQGRRDGLFICRAKEAFAAQLKSYAELCVQAAVPAPVLSQCWLLSKSDVTSIIVGPRTVDQLTASLKAIDTRVDQKIFASAEQIWPGPGGEAPEAYGQSYKNLHLS